MTHNWNHKAEKYIPPGYLLHSHGKSPCLIGKPSISMGHLYHGELLVITRGYKHMIRSIFDRPNLEFKWTCIGKQTELLELFKGMDPNHKPWNGREIGYMMVIWWLYDGIITYYVYIYIYMVGGARTILKNDGVKAHGKDDIPYMKWTITFMFETTKQCLLDYNPISL